MATAIGPVLTPLEPLMKRLTLAFLACALALPTAAQAGALDCPSVELIVGFGAGGGTDLFARSIHPKLEEELGVPVQVLNVTGGSGAVAFSEVASRPADGCTVFAITTDYVLLEVTNAADLSLTDMNVLVRAHVDVGLLNAAATGPESLEAMLEAAGDRALLIGGVGSASFDEGAVKILMDQVDAEYRYIPYDGAKEMHADLLGGRLDLAYDEVGVMLPMVEAGQIRPLVVAFGERVDVLPDVPTAGELGLSLSPPIWRGIAVAGGTPPEAASAIAAAVEVALKEGAYVDYEKGRSLDLAPGFAGPDEFPAVIEAEIERFGAAMAQ